jgi:hypothetical protein
MEEDVEPRDEDGVDGRGVCRWDGWVGGLGTVGASSLFGLVRGTGVFDEVLPTFVSVQEYNSRNDRDNDTSFSTVSSSRRETMLGGTLTRASAFRVGLDDHRHDDIVRRYRHDDRHDLSHGDDSHDDRHDLSHGDIVIT